MWIVSNAFGVVVGVGPSRDAALVDASLKIERAIVRRFNEREEVILTPLDVVRTFVDRHVYDVVEAPEYTEPAKYGL